MKYLPIIAISLLAAGCTSTTGTLIGGGFGALSQQMAGTGTMIQRPDGSKGFRYVIQANANEHIAGDQEKLRMDALSRWMGNTQNCVSGYVIDSQNVKKIGFGAEAFIYEGHCK